MLVGTRLGGRLLIRCQVDLEFADGEVNTPLVAAARYGHEQVTELLLVAGANRLARNGFGWSVTGWNGAAEWEGWPSPS
jgi:hypothetical protein